MKSNLSLFFIAITVILFNTSAQDNNDSLFNSESRPASAQDTVQKGAVTDQITAAENQNGFQIGAGVGFSIGSIPLFSLWQKSLPDSLSRFGLDVNSGMILPDTLNSVEADTNRLTYEIAEKPEVYNITLPLYLSLMHVKDNRMLTLSASFLYTSKQFQAMVYPEPDTLDRRVSISEKMNFYSLALELEYQKAIPAQYFLIEGTDQAFLSAAFSVSPLSTFSKKSQARTSVSPDDTRMQSIRDSIQSRLNPISSTGAALAWRLGISTMKRYQDGGGLQIGLHYSGSWHSFFSDEGAKILNRDIYYKAAKADNPLSFVSNRIELKVSIFRSLGKGAKNETGS